MKALHMIAFLVLVVGGLNWLLVGLFNWDISALLGGMSSPIAKIIYILVGVAAIYEVVTHKSRCRECSTSAPSGGAMAS